MQARYHHARSSRRASPLLLATTSAVFPKDKKNKHSGLPEDILRARTAMVVIAPDAGEPLKDPQANIHAQDDVEKALLKWRRFEVVGPSEPGGSHNYRMKRYRQCGQPHDQRGARRSAASNPSTHGRIGTGSRTCWSADRCRHTRPDWQRAPYGHGGWEPR